MRRLSKNQIKKLEDSFFEEEEENVEIEDLQLFS